MVNKHTKTYKTIEDMFQASRAMTVFQVMHNSIRIDYAHLLQLTESYVDDKISFDAMYRASLRSLLSIIESDIHGLNQLDPYPDYNDKHSFKDRFKRTYKQIATTWQKVTIYNKYSDSNLGALFELKRKRDELVHPKSTTHLHSATLKDFEELKNGFSCYNNFVKELMTDFWVGVTVPSINLLNSTTK